MLGGEGYFRGGSLLVSGTAGTGKSSIATHCVSACNFDPLSRGIGVQD
jgi:circadian clock protein KaiC